MKSVGVSLWGFAVISLGLSGCATNRPTGVHRTSVEREALVTVTDIDVPRRLVAVRDVSGESFTVYVSESNKNFPQAHVGDQVRVRYVESLALRLTKKDAGAIKLEEATTQPTAAQAAGKASSQVTAVVRIDSVKPDGSAVAFTGPRGHRAIRVSDPAMREYVRKLHPGDHVEATYEEALALSLERVDR